MIKRSKEALTADFGPRKVVFHTGRRVPYILNDTAALLWEFCKPPKSEAEMAAYLRRIYGITAGRAKKDIARFVKELEKKGVIEIYGRRT